MAMFPPAIPHVFVRWLTEPGDVVYDPFSGRGTAPAEASLLGRVGLGSDLNPLAYVLTGAKVDPPSSASLRRRLRELKQELTPMQVGDVPPKIRPLFDDHTLGQLLWLKQALDVRRRADRFLMAVLLGNLHLNARADGQPRGLTVSMPNTFAMAPGYVAKYIRTQSLVPPRVDVLDFLEERATMVAVEREGFRRGRAWIQDASSRSPGLRSTEEPKLVFTSPPYLEVIRYGKFNWIRLWLLGVDGWDLDRDLFTSASLDKYVDFMSASIARSTARLRPDGYACFVIGDVRRGDETINLAREVEANCVPDHLSVMGTIVDRIPSGHKVSRIWKNSKGRATKTDRLLLLAGRDATVPDLGRIIW